jgi:hypothetical protein
MVTISAAKWLSWIASASKVVLKKREGPPLITDVRRHKSKIDSREYLSDRDKFREKDGKPPQWAGANISNHHKLMGRANSIGDRVITQRIGLIKRWQWHSARADNICAGCEKQISGISHPLRHCTHEDMIGHRERWWKSVDATIMSCNRAFHDSFFSITRRMRETEGGEIACCGSFLPKFVLGLPNNQVTVNDHYMKSLNKVLKVVVSGTRQLLRVAAELQLGLGGINWRQTAITSYFKPADRKKVTRKRTDWSNAISAPSPPSAVSFTKNKKKKNDIDSNIAHKNRNLSVDQIFSYIDTGGGNYWEFKAG